MNELFQIFILDPIFNILLAIYQVIPGGDFGLTIIVFTLLVKFAMYPLLRRQLNQTSLMRKLQPELARIKRAAAGNRQLEAMQQMELYKKYGVKPFSSIGVLLVQLPIMIALYQVIQIMTMHRDQIAAHAYDAVEKFSSVQHLIQHPDQFSQQMLGFISLTRTAIGSGGVDIALCVLAVIAGITQYIISKQIMPTTGKKRSIRQIMADAAEGKQADATDMNAAVAGNMAKIMPFMMFFIMINLPGAIALYYVVTNLVQLAQQHYILRQDEIEMDEIATEAIVAKPAKKATTKARERAAREGNITRIVAKGTPPKKGKRS